MIRRIDEDRVRKVAADNPDLLHCRLAQRFGISVEQLRKILGLKGRVGELISPQEIARANYTPLPAYSHAGRFAAQRRMERMSAIRKKLLAQENEKRGGFNPDFKPLLPSTRRGGP